MKNSRSSLNLNLHLSHSRAALLPGRPCQLRPSAPFPPSGGASSPSPEGWSKFLIGVFSHCRKDQRNRGGTSEEAQMKLDHPVLKVTTQKAHSLLDRRYAERVPIRYRITYSGEEGARIVTGGGALKDLPKTGCKILGATTSTLGSRIILLLDLEDGQAPLRPPTSSSPGPPETRLPSGFR